MTGRATRATPISRSSSSRHDLEESTPSSSLTDTTVFLGGRYYYYVTTLFKQWESNPSDTVDAEVEAITSLIGLDRIPITYDLKQNFPNPFNPTTIIKYELPHANHVELRIFNLLGQKISTLVSEVQRAGQYQVEWNATGFAGGIYYYHIVAGDFQDVKKMILLR